jgi:hypothetical protein
MNKFVGDDVELHAFLISALGGGLHAPAALAPGKITTVSIRYLAGWAPEPCWTQWRGEKFPPGIEP